MRWFGDVESFESHHWEWVGGWLAGGGRAGGWAVGRRAEGWGMGWGYSRRNDRNHLVPKLQRMNERMNGQWTMDCG